MIRNKKGQGILLFSLLVAFVLFFVGVIALNFIEDSITQARTDNSCANPLSDGGKLLCLLFDGITPYFIVMFLSAAGGLVTSRFLT